MRVHTWAKGLYVDEWLNSTERWGNVCIQRWKKRRIFQDKNRALMQVLVYVITKFIYVATWYKSNKKMFKSRQLNHDVTETNDYFNMCTGAEYQFTANIISYPHVFVYLCITLITSYFLFSQSVGLLHQHCSNHIMHVANWLRSILWATISAFI